MNLVKENWYKEDYFKFQKYLLDLQDLEYLKFHKNLVKDVTIIGVRMPILKEIASNIAKGNYQEFLKIMQHDFYEENTIHGLILGYINIPFEDLLILIEDFIKYNNNWATNDTVCSNLKCFKKNQTAGLKLINKFLNSEECYKVRFGLILLLDHYLDECHIDYILNVCNDITSEEYYIKMANAWLISICYIKYPEQTKKFLETTKIDKWTYNKAISKICDSYRVDKNTKIELKKTRK